MAKVKKLKAIKRSNVKSSSAKKTVVKKKPAPKPARVVASKPSKSPSRDGRDGRDGREKEAPTKIPDAPKNLTPELLAIRQRLTTMLAEMHENIEHEVHGASDRDAAHINDTSDMASDAAEGDLSLRIAESETAEAGEIERAIEKIDQGTYGTCEICNKAIGADRMLFLPYVTMCIRCQELAEIRKRDDEDELDDLAEGSDYTES
jgi:RNA polymerase-binding protein DksA